MPVVICIIKAVRKAAPLFETDIYALLAMEDTEHAKKDTVYVFEAQRKEVVSQKSISSAVSDVHFIRFDSKGEDGDIHKADSVVFFGFDDVHICNPDKFDSFKTINGNKNIGTIKSVVQEKGLKKLAFLGINPDEVKIVDLNNEFDITSFKPFKAGQVPSFLSFSEDVRNP